MLPHPLTNFEIQKYYHNQPKFNGVYWRQKYYHNQPKFNGFYSRDNLFKVEDRAYVINVDEYSDIGTHWVALYVQNNDVTYFDSFGVEHIPEEMS